MVPVKDSGGGHSYYGLCPWKSISWVHSGTCGPSIAFLPHVKTVLFKGYNTFKWHGSEQAFQQAIMILIPSQYDPYEARKVKVTRTSKTNSCSFLVWFCSDDGIKGKIKPIHGVGQCETFPTVYPVLGFDPRLVRTSLRKFMTTFGHQIGCSASWFKIGG